MTKEQYKAINATKMQADKLFRTCDAMHRNGDALYRYHYELLLKFDPKKYYEEKVRSYLHPKTKIND